MGSSFRKKQTAGRSSTPAGALDPKKQLEEAYAKIFKNEGVEEEWRKEFFQKVRILVLGKSGAGKTTLIRFMVGKEGPQTITDGVAGVQDINKAFIFSTEEQGAPLLIHDSNGMDLRGKERVDEIREFLERHQKADDFTEKIHMIWYIISAIDPRCVDDGDVMSMIGEFKIPLLLIMTHNDYERQKVSEASLRKLLEGYGNEEQREEVLKMMVKVGNDGVTHGAEDELIIEERKRDKEGLREVARRTQKLMDKRLRYTWVAAQAVDIDGKLKKSAEMIAGYARSALLTSLPRVIPFADPIKLSIIFWRVMVTMCTIWGTPKGMRETMKEVLLMSEGGSQVLRRAGEDLLLSAGCVVAIGATLVTAGAVAVVPAVVPAVVATLVAPGVLNMGKAVPAMVTTFSMEVLGTILYVKSTQVMSNNKHGWDPDMSKEEYKKAVEEFAQNAEYQEQLRGFVKEEYSWWDMAMRKKKVKGIIRSKILQIYRNLLLARPNSLFSLLKYSDPENKVDMKDEIMEHYEDTDDDDDDSDEDNGYAELQNLEEDDFN